MKKLSVVISAFNEERNIEECLKSVNFADEIIVIDNQSIDTTAKIAKKHKAKVYEKPNNLMLNVNKNFGFTKATGEWVLNLDADERVTPQLRDEILALIADTKNQTEGYEIPRKNIIFGKVMMHTGWYPDLNLRLFKNGKGKFNERHVHEKIVVEGETGTLNNFLIHENYNSVKEFFRKTVLIYAPNEADQLLENGYVFSYADVIRFPLREFLGRFFAREGYKDGYHGLVLSFLMACYHLVVFAYIWEKKRFVDEHESSLPLFKEQVKLAKKDLSYWLNTSEVAHASNPFVRLFYLIRRKL
ncbi:MAG: glycosyltransferase family 2 protein [bacterium]|nr:glycosyltransferase family 2 protein [bacterium]